MSPANGRPTPVDDDDSLDATEPLVARTDDLTEVSPRTRRGWLRRLWGGGQRDGSPDAAIERALPPRHRRLADPVTIGRGGMAMVESVFDRAVRRRVARKVLLPERAGKLLAVQAFFSEAQITGQLDHPNIVPVYDFGRDEEGRLFFTMKQLTGRTLAKVVADLPAGPPDRSTLFDLLEIVIKIADALAFAHQRGVVHGDVKPENVMVGRFGQVYLVDWGLARAHRRAGSGEGDRAPVSVSFDRVWNDRMSGTPGFLSPEQAEGKALDDRTDVFGLGATLYFVLGRTAPYRGRNLAEVVRRARAAELAPLADSPHACGLPRELGRIVDRAMARRRQDRYQRITELKDDLVGFLRGGTLPRERFAAGRHIVREGEAGERAYLIVSGRCEVVKREDGRERRIRVLEAGDCFGETAILAAAPRTASVVALEDTVVECISGEELLEEVNAMKPAMGTLLRTLAERFRERETEPSMTDDG